MLASLLPGLRDVRTPLTVGYLWLLNGWLLWGDKFPRTKPQQDGPLARLFDLVEIFGPGSAIAAVSFVAYVLGAIATFSVETGPAAGIASVWPAVKRDWRPEAEYEGFVRDHSVAGYFPISKIFPVAELRPRLLVANAELYGEYDRLAAEAALRMNLCLPILALGTVVTASGGQVWLPPAILVAGTLFTQGTTKLREANAVIQRAVIAGVIEHPWFAASREILREKREPPAGEAPSSAP